MMRLLLGLLLVFVGLSASRAQTIDDLYGALETSDTRTVEAFVQAYYRDAGISVNDTLIWEHQRFDEIVNWYNQHTEVIMLSELPRPAEVAAYWQNWSQVLTQGGWDWQAFFASDAEAGLMANFNQFLLAAHEFGHALTYRYDPGHEERYGDEINCREYLPDRLAASLLEEVAEKDARIAGLKTRYRALIEAINAEIAPEYRYDTPTFAALDADCRVMHVEQPTEDTMTPYASAFFVRHGLLQAADLPPLAEVYEKHLFPWWRDAQPPASGRAGAVTTIGAVAIPDGSIGTGLETETRLIAFAADGTVHIVGAGFDTSGTSARVAFTYGPAGGEQALVLAPEPLSGVTISEYGFFGLQSAISLGPDRFVVITGNLIGSVPALLLDIRQRGGTWSMRVIDLEPDPAIFSNFTITGLVFGPDATPYAFLLGSEGWRRLKLDPQTLDTVETLRLPYSYATPVAVGPDGETYFSADYQITAVALDGATTAFAGARLQGFKDNADPLRAEFARGSTEGVLLADGMTLLDFDPGTRSFVFRHIGLAK